MPKYLFLVICLLALSLLVSCEQATPIPNPVIGGDLPEIPKPNYLDPSAAIVAEAKLRAAALPASASNLLNNPSFENGQEGWYACSNTENVSLVNDSVEGTQALKVTKGCIYQTLAINTPGQLNLSCMVKAPSSVGWSGMGLNTTTLAVPSQTIAGNVYREYSTSLMINQGESVCISVWLYTDSEIVIDDCALYMGEASLPQGELLLNGGFGGGLEHWSNCANPTSLNVLNGEFQASSGACAYQIINARPGIGYQLTCKAKIQQAGWNTLILSMMNQNWVEIDKAYIPIKATSLKNYILSLNAPSESRHIAVAFYSESGAIFDDCSLKAIPALPVNPQNYLKNADFEAGLAHWQPCGDIDFLNDATKAYNGAQGLLFYAPMNAADCIRQEVPVTETGKSYLLSCQTSSYDPTQEGLSPVFMGVPVSMNLRMFISSDPNVGSGAAGDGFWGRSNYTYQASPGARWGLYVTAPTTLIIELQGTGAFVDGCELIAIVP
ncbi:MAG: hypothetical protein R2880_07990 [Deinococcales bacterium]